MRRRGFLKIAAGGAAALPAAIALAVAEEKASARMSTDVPIRLNTQADWEALHRTSPRVARQYLKVAILRDFGLSLPDRIFTHGHSCPFDFIADAFFHPGKDVAAWANRSGIKTLGASILAALEFRFNRGLQARVLSGSQYQATILYGYFEQWCDGILAGHVAGDITALRTSVNGGKIGILAASQKQIKGGKVQRLFEDELDEIKQEYVASALGMIASMPGMPGRTVYTSTWDKVSGPMQQLVDGCPENGVTLHRWNIWESVRNCPPERHQDGDGCSECPLSKVCVAKAQEFHMDRTWKIGIAAEACGLYDLDDLIKVYRKAGQGIWESQYECKRPNVAGLVYPAFDAGIHRCDKPPRDLKIYRAIDWGLNVFVCLWVGQDKDGGHYVLDTYRAERAKLATHIRYIKAHPIQKIVRSYCDPAGRNVNDQTGKSNVAEFKAAGIPCTYTLATRLRNVQNGIQMIRADLQPADGPPRLRYVPNKNSGMFVRAMQSYSNRKVNEQWIDEPKDPQEYEHIPDALRYYRVNRERSGSIGVVGLSAS